MRRNRWDKSGRSDRRQVDKGQTREGNDPKVPEKRTYQSINERLLKEPLSTSPLFLFEQQHIQKKMFLKPAFLVKIL